MQTHPGLLRRNGDVSLTPAHVVVILLLWLRNGVEGVRGGRISVLRRCSLKNKNYEVLPKAAFSSGFFFFNVF